MLTLKIFLFVIAILFSFAALIEKENEIRIHFTSITIAGLICLTSLYVASLI